MLADIRFLNKFKLMDYSLLLITEVNPFYTEQRKLTIAQKKERSSSNVAGASNEPDNPLALLSANNPSVVPEVPENMETEDDNMSFQIPSKVPARDEFASQKHLKVDKNDMAEEFYKNMNRQNTLANSKGANNSMLGKQTSIRSGFDS